MTAHRDIDYIHIYIVCTCVCLYNTIVKNIYIIIRSIKTKTLVYYVKQYTKNYTKNGRIIHASYLSVDRMWG